MDKAKILDAVIPSVKAQLKSPTSAIFCEARELTVSNIGGNDYKVEGYVSSQNGYGAMIKNDFSCTVKENGSSYSVTKCIVGAKTQAANTANFLTNWVGLMILTAIGGGILYFLINAFVGNSYF